MDRQLHAFHPHLFGPGKKFFLWFVSNAGYFLAAFSSILISKFRAHQGPNCPVFPLKVHQFISLISKKLCSICLLPAGLILRFEHKNTKIFIGFSFHFKNPRFAGTKIPVLIPCSLFAVPCSPFPVLCSQFSVCRSPFSVPCSLPFSPGLSYFPGWPNFASTVMPHFRSAGGWLNLIRTV
jgi:hypothetical protein